MEALDTGACFSGSWTLGSSSGLFAFSFLLGFAIPLKEKDEDVSVSIYRCENNKVKGHYPGAILKADSWVCEESPEEE